MMLGDPSPNTVKLKVVALNLEFLIVIYTETERKWSQLTLVKQNGQDDSHEIMYREGLFWKDALI